MSKQFLEMPDEKGYFGEYGGQIIPPPLIEIMDQIDDAYEIHQETPRSFKTSLLIYKLIILAAPALFIMRSASVIKLAAHKSILNVKT